MREETRTLNFTRDEVLSITDAVSDRIELLQDLSGFDYGAGAPDVTQDYQSEIDILQNVLSILEES